eukprot:CAMPEP_0167815158 /NCGR_PEP_ID=MMETSP0112_2-20121227/2847_1 /TAXON_ID=91324 /ORGANISM="Lotharella globosa, Strain CCCM811" /LENGTH=381 /DNA_ID=CAMNT_0007714507 /DNA_START=156 /DNA_END=1301 /DNA_ORIENTATION=+
MGACGSSEADRTQRTLQETPKTNDPNSPNQAKGAWGDDPAKTREKPKPVKAKKKDSVTAFEAPKETTATKKEESKPQQDMVESMPKRSLEDVRPKQKIVAGKPAHRAENSPGRAAPGFLATPEQSPTNATTSKTKHEEENQKKGAGKGEDEASSKTHTIEEAASDMKRVAKRTGSKKIMEPSSARKKRPVFFQKPAFEDDNFEVDDLPCEVLSSSKAINKIPHDGKASPVDASRSSEPEQRKTLEPKHKHDFLKKGSSRLASTLPPIGGGGGKKKLAPLKFDKKKHNDFRKNINKLKKGKTKSKKMERYITKKLKMPSKAADLILVYAAIKTSKLSEFNEGDVLLTSRQPAIEGIKVAGVNTAPQAFLAPMPSRGLMAALA